MPEEKEISFIRAKDKNFPQELLQTPWPPKGIYTKGPLETTRPKVAIVGTRRATSYGKEAAFKIAEALAEKDVIIVSGLALGIDSAAHEGALAAGGTTWAVLGSGLENIYPKMNASLAKKITEKGGALISEYPPKNEAREWTFPERNRIIAGLSQLTIVIEAPEKSGAMITARLALEAGREVAALVADISRENSQGSNALIRDGAHPITSIKDALYLLGIEAVEKIKKFDKLDEIEEAILQTLNEPKSADEIIMETNLKAELVSEKLMGLELKNIINRNTEGWHKKI